MCIVIGPGGLLELECSALADAAGEGIGKPARIQHHWRQFGRVETSQCHLRRGSIGQPHGADLAVAPRLLNDPGQGVNVELADNRFGLRYPLALQAR